MHGEDPKSSGVQPPGGGLDRQDAGLIWQIAQAMIAVVELRDPFTARHQRRVAQLACALGASWGLGESYLFELRAAALVHDIGKIAIP
jgi:HD-GYP domain-containing protein (c-di-GMP phosphodiesterase class II)